MKHIIVFFFCCLCLISCSAQHHHEYQLKKTDTDASCDTYAIISYENKIRMNNEITEALYCPSVIGLHNQKLYYQTANSIKQYNLSTQKAHTLFTLYPDIDGIAGPFWSPDYSQIAFTIVNQQMNHGYQNYVRIIVFEINKKGEVSNKRKYDVDAYFDCGSRCGSDIKFKDNQTIRYRDIMDKGGAIDDIHYKYLKLN